MIRLLNWRLVVAVAAAALACALLVATITGAQDSREKGRRIDVLIGQAERDHAAADAEREQLLAGQRELERRLDVMVRGDERLLRYLARHGVVVPHRLTRFLIVATSQSTRAPAPDLPGRSDTHRRSR